MLRVGSLNDDKARAILERGRSELPRLEAAAKNGTLKSKDFDAEIYGCRTVKDALWKTQSARCCFCERDYESSHSTVEHFRPKTSARRSADQIDPGYWWLAYDPDNLLFACVVCNNLKRDWFPLAPRSPVLSPDRKKGSRRERPMLLDPRRDDPAAHLTYVWWDRLQSYAIAALSDRGLKTIEILGLDREALVWLRRRYYHYYLAPIIASVEEASKQRPLLPSPVRELAGPDATLGFFTRCVLLHRGFLPHAVAKAARA